MSATTSGRIARAATAVALFGVLSRLLGFVREAVLSRTVGTTSSGDAFVNSLFLVNTVAAILLYALVTLVIPAFEQERERAGPESAWRLLWSIAAWVGIGLIGLGALVGLWPEGVAAIYQAPPSTTRLMEHILPIMAPGLMLQGLSALLTAVLQARRRFIGPAAIGVAFNLGIILGLALGGGTVTAAAWGVSGGAAAQILLQLPQLVRVLRTEAGRPSFGHAKLAGVGALAAPVLGASVLQQVNGYTDKLFANHVGPGRATALNLANAAGSAARTALLFPLLTPLFPVVARLMAERRESETLRAFARAGAVLALISIPMSAFLAIYAQEITVVAFKGHRCGSTCVSWTKGPLVFYALATWGSFIGYLLNRTLSAANRARDIMLATVVTVVVTVALDLAFLGPLEQTGLALATAIGIYANTGITLYLLRRQFHGMALRPIVSQQGRLVACGAVAAGVALALNLGLPSTGRGRALMVGLVLAKVAVAAGAYVAAARLIAPVELGEGRRAALALLPRTRRSA